MDGAGHGPVVVGSGEVLAEALVEGGGHGGLV
jgi:hypothetical protein